MCLNGSISQYAIFNNGGRTQNEEVKNNRRGRETVNLKCGLFVIRAMRARFLDKSQKLLNGSDQEVAECMKCSQPPSDIIFIFDDSGSIGSE